MWFRGVAVRGSGNGGGTHISTDNANLQSVLANRIGVGPIVLHCVVLVPFADATVGVLYTPPFETQYLDIRLREREQWYIRLRCCAPFALLRPRERERECLLWERLSVRQSQRSRLGGSFAAWGPRRASARVAARVLSWSSRAA